MRSLSDRQQESNSPHQSQSVGTKHKAIPMDWKLALQQSLVVIDERSRSGKERVVIHPARGSVVCVSNAALQELDAATGATTSEISFDLPIASATATSDISACSIDLLSPVGSDYVVGICQSSNLAVWNLHDESLECIVDLERGQSSKAITAVAGSLCRDQWLFFCIEGSPSIKVVSLSAITALADGKDHGLPFKKISRKTTNRSSQLTTLAYQTALRLLACGSSDGTFQLWAYASSSDDESGTSTGVSSMKDDVAPASLLFTSTLTAGTASPIVHLEFASSSCTPASSSVPSSPHYLVVAYQNRAVEVWALGSIVGGRRPRDPQRLASAQLPHQTGDFAKKNGELCFAMHPQLALLAIVWSPSTGKSSSNVAIWEFGKGNAHSRSSSIKWRDAKAININTGHPAKALNMSDSDPSTAIAVYWLNQSLRMCACDPTSLSLSAYQLQSVQSSGIGKTSAQSSCVPVRGAYSTVSMLSLEQYYNYQDAPSALLQVSMLRKATNGAGEMLLQRFSLLTGSSDSDSKLVGLPQWMNYQGAQLAPWEILANTAQTAACIKLRERGGDTMAGSEPFSYVVMEIKKATSSGAAVARSNDDEDGDDSRGGASSGCSGYRVTCGGQMDALDLCFCEGMPSTDGTVPAPWRLVVLSITGKSLNFQTQCGQIDSTSGVLLTQQVRRVFQTPMPLYAASPYAQTVGVRLLYLLASAESSPDVVVLSGDDLSVPAVGSSAGSCAWTSQANEQVLHVQWNSSSTARLDSNEPPASAILAAVWTSRRLVILSGPSMTEIRAYDLPSELQEHQSALWMAQTLLIATHDHQVRYLTPMVPNDEKMSANFSSHLLCSLRVPGSSDLQCVQLLAACGDRLCYAVNNSSTLECRSFVRPMPLCEPLLLGFSESASPQSLAMLRSIFEREVLAFLQSGSDSPACPFSNTLLEVAYYRFGWKKAVVQVLNAVLGRNGDPAATTGSNSSPATAASAGASSSAGGFSRASHLSRPLLASLLLDAHKWRDALRVFLADDPALEEYVFADTMDDDGGSVSSAKLPSRTSEIARQYRQLASVMDALGQSGLAARCLDLAGDDLALLEMLHRLGSSAKCDARAMLTALSKDLARLNAPLAAVMEATVSAKTPEQEDLVELDAKLASPVWRRHDLVSLLCCETLQQTERRSRLLSTIRPFDKMVVSPAAPLIEDIENQQRQAMPPAKVLSWKRLAPEDSHDWIGGLSTTMVSTEDPKPLSYALFASAATKTATVAGAFGETLGSALIAGSALPVADALALSASASISSKMTIGPFLEEEDAVVAYWRFEEGATNKAGATDDAASSSLESVDTSKRENHLTLRGFGSTVKLVSSTAPVDRGEEGKLQEEFALQFPGSDQVTPSSSDWGVSCAVRTGGTLDIGFVFDEDPYRRKLSVEAWVRDFALAREQRRHREEEDGQDGDDTSTKASSSRSTPNARRSLASRRSPDGATVWWELAVGEDGRLELAFGTARVLRADSPVENVGAWHHVAFTADVTSPKLATLRLFLNAKCVASQEVATVDANAAYYGERKGGDDEQPVSVFMIGDRDLRDSELTEVRVWASARSAEQLGDMKENYLAMAEAKRRMKIAIHQRNCACAKCTARRAAATAGAGAAGGAKKLPLASPFMSAPPSTARDRRRPGNK